MSTAAMRRVATALLLLVAGSGFALGPATAAGAATCTSSGGVSVVVDFRELGGATVTACASDGGGKSAAAIFDSVGVSLSYATRQPGFVCRVNGAPAAAPCVNASPENAYWGLWWADGTASSWTFSSSGVGGLIVPAGGSVGWSWQQDRGSSGVVPPGVAPPVNPSTPSSSPTPTSSPTSSPTGGTGGSGGSTPTSSPSPGKGGGKGGGSGSSPSSSASSSPSSSPSGTPSSSPSDNPSESPLVSESPGDSQTSDGAEGGSQDPSPGSESPGDSRTSDGSESSASASESPGDSPTSTPSDAASPEAGEPTRVPAAVTWGALGLLVVASLVGALVARRRRGA